jgi:large subunit ribosomal protein L25
VVTADINIVLIGDADAVHKADGVVNQELFSLTIHATPDKIPHQLDVDISKLEIGDTIRVDDLHLPAGVSTDTDGETTVIVAQPPQVSEEDLIPEGAEAPAEAAEEGAEGAEEGAEAGEGGGEEASASDTEA